MRKHANFYGLLGIFVFFTLNAQAATPAIGAQSDQAVGSFVGRAVVHEPWCVPGTPQCPIPYEIFMLPTFFSDGNFMGIDSNVFLGDHTEAHGQWIRTGQSTVEANWLFLQSDESGRFAGSFRLRLQAESLDQDNMRGYINAYFIPFTDENGAVIVDPESGFPVPDPLAPVGDFMTDGSECAPALNGCFGVFTFDVRRIKVTPDGGLRPVLPEALETLK